MITDDTDFVPLLADDVMIRIGRWADSLLNGVPRFPLRLINEDGDENLVYFPDGNASKAKLSAGRYEVRIHTPWGQIFQAKATVSGKGVKVEAKANQPFDPEALSWILFEPKVLAGLSATVVDPRKCGFRYGFWTQHSNRWVQVDENKELGTRMEFYEAEGHSFGRLAVHAAKLRPLWFWVDGPSLPAQVVAVPPVFNAEVLIVPDLLGGSSLRVTARSLEPVSRDLNAFLSCGDGIVARFLLKDGVPRPFRPEYFFLHLMRAYHGYAPPEAGQPKEFDGATELLPDAWVADARKETSKDTPNFAWVRDRLLKGAQLGIPVWPTSLRELYVQLKNLLQRDGAGRDEEVFRALRQIEPYAVATRPASVIRFFALALEEPLFAAAPSLERSQTLHKSEIARNKPLPTMDLDHEISSDGQESNFPLDTPGHVAPSASQSLHRGSRKQWIGLVISARSHKTIVVLVVRRKPHPKFGKIIKVSKKYHAHDEEEIAREGDTVLIQETRPLSKMKHSRFVKVILRGGKSSRSDHEKVVRREPAAA